MDLAKIIDRVRDELEEKLCKDLLAIIFRYYTENSFLDPAFRRACLRSDINRVKEYIILFPYALKQDDVSIQHCVRYSLLNARIDIAEVLMKNSIEITWKNLSQDMTELSEMDLFDEMKWFAKVLIQREIYFDIIGFEKAVSRASSQRKIEMIKWILSIKRNIIGEYSTEIFYEQFRLSNQIEDIELFLDNFPLKDAFGKLMDSYYDNDFKMVELLKRKFPQYVKDFERNISKSRKSAKKGSLGPTGSRAPSGLTGSFHHIGPVGPIGVPGPGCGNLPSRPWRVLNKFGT